MSELNFTDSDGLEGWLLGQKREVAILIAVRAALRVLPLLYEGMLRSRDQSIQQLEVLSAACFRATSVAQIAARYPVVNFDRFAAADAAQSADGRANFLAFEDRGTADAVYAAGRAAAAAVTAASVSDAVAAVAAADAAARAKPRSTAARDLSTQFSAHNEPTIWATVLADARFIKSKAGPTGLSEQPLWLGRTPEWASEAWQMLQVSLPKDHDWGVWFRWYEDRLAGSAHSEEYELIFATVPVEVWDKGAAAANAWIKEHLPPVPPTDSEPLTQNAALFSFRLVNGKIAVAPEAATAADSEAARDFHAEALRKAGALKLRLIRAQADQRLIDNIALLEARLGARIKDIRPGLILSSMRSLESDYRNYDTEEGRKEHAPDLLSMLDDLAGTVRDLASQFPKTREIIASQLALAIGEDPDALKRAEEASEELAGATEWHPLLVTHDAGAALREPGQSIATSRSLKDRAGQLGLRLLTVINFARIVARTREAASAFGREVGKQVPKAIGHVAAGGVKAGAALAFAHWAGAEGLALLLVAAGAIEKLNAAVGKRGGVFDRLLKTIEKIAAGEKPAPPSGEKRGAPAKKAQKPVRKKSPPKNKQRTKKSP